MSKKPKRKSSRDPVRYDPPFEFEQDEEPLAKQPKYKTKLVYLLDQDEVNMLVDASTAEYVDEIPPEFHINYATYSEEEVLALLDCDYTPRKFKKKK